MDKEFMKIVMLLCILTLSFVDLKAQLIDDNKQIMIIDSVSNALNEIYIFPKVAKKMEKHIRSQFRKHEYHNITDIAEFTDKLTEDLRSVSQDAHLHVRFESDDYFHSSKDDTLINEVVLELYVEEAYDNFGFVKVERMDGNVGYVQMRGFYDIERAGPTAIAAMNFLAHCDAIIFDLRVTLGGEPNMIQLLLSYFFNESVQLSSFYIRKEDKEKQFWTFKHVNGPQMADVKLYVLISQQTPSAAEAFAYDLKHLKRAMIIGETTRGAAHPSEEITFASLNIVISVPYGRAINPITGTNWEGVGVVPHKQVSANEALDVAYLEALNALLLECKDNSRKAPLEWAKKRIEARLNPVVVTEEGMKEYIGKYGLRRVFIKEGELYYQRKGRTEYRMVPLANNIFMLDGLEVLRIQFVRDSSGVVRKMVSLLESGPLRTYEKEK